MREDRLRQAEVSFITDRQRRPAEHWWDQLCVEVISLRKFLVRVRSAKWVGRRDQYWNEVQQEILRQSKYRAVHDRVAELNEIQSIRSDALEAIQPKIIDGRKIYPIRPKSMEGMIAAFVKLDQLADAKRDTVLTMIEPELTSEVGAGSSSVFSADEMRDVAKMLLERRRDEQQARLALDTGGQNGSGSEEVGSEEVAAEEGRSEAEGAGKDC